MSEKFLRNISIGYLALPNFLFYFFWVKTPIAVLGSVALLYLLVKGLLDKDYADAGVLTSKNLLLIFAVSALLTVVSGICGLTFQNLDYWAHNAKFYELMSYTWPIRFEKTIISYYYGYYVVPGLFLKMTGDVHEIFIFVWTWLGLALGIAWIYLVLNKKMVLVWLALCVGDFPRILKSVLSLISIKLYEFEDFGIEIWSNFENLLWVPNQTIPTLLIGGMFVYGLKRKLNVDLLVLPIALSFWWAVFPSFISGLLIGILSVKDWFLSPVQRKPARIFDRVLLPFLVSLPVLIFFLSHEESPLSGFVWSFRNEKTNLVAEYLVNIGLNVGVFAALYVLQKKSALQTFDPVPAYLVLLFSTVLPFYRMGEVNDILFRGMMPLLIIIGMYLLYPLSLHSVRDNFTFIRKYPVMMILMIIIFSSSLMSFGRLARAAKHNVIFSETALKRETFEPIPYDLYANVYEVIKVKWSKEGADQYKGNADSFYERHMAPDKK